MTKRRWWLWLWPDGREHMSSSVAAGDDCISCTEVQLAPINAVVCVRGTPEWYKLPPDPPPWTPKPDDRVRWYRGEDNGTGWYTRVVETPMYRAPGHLVRIGSKGGEGSVTGFWVERVEPMEEDEG